MRNGAKEQPEDGKAGESKASLERGETSEIGDAVPTCGGGISGLQRRHVSRGLLAGRSPTTPTLGDAWGERIDASIDRAAVVVGCVSSYLLECAALLFDRLLDFFESFSPPPGN